MTDKTSPALDPEPRETAVEPTEKRQRIVETRNLDGITYSLEWNRCGHADRCNRCKQFGYGHGPYWTARWWDAEAGKGRTVSRYIGKKFRILQREEVNR